MKFMKEIRTRRKHFLYFQSAEQEGKMVKKVRDKKEERRTRTMIMKEKQVKKEKMKRRARRRR
jgi:hypothetical protein